MGQSPTSTLVFGIPIVEDDDYNMPAFMQESDFYMDDYIEEQAGMSYDTHTYEERAAAKAVYPVCMVMHSTYDDPDYVLAIPGTEITASWGDAHTFEDGLPADPPQEKIDVLKAWAAERGVEGEPRWMLLAMFG